MNILLSFGADFLVIFASLGAMTYCMVLSRRLSRLTSFDKGLGGAIAVMSAQVDEMKAVLRDAKAGSDGAGTQLHDLVHQAREISSELEMMIAACHDFAEEAISVQTPRPDRVTPDEAAPVTDLVPQSDPGAMPTSDAPDLTAVFGSRRSQPEPLGDASASIEPLFGRHKSGAS